MASSDVSARALRGRYTALSEELAGHMLRRASFDSIAAGDLSNVKATDAERWFSTESSWLSSRFASLSADISELDRLHDRGEVSESDYDEAEGVLEEATEQAHADARVAISAAKVADAEFGTEWGQRLSGLFVGAPEPGRQEQAQASPSVDPIREAEEAQIAREEAAEREREAIDGMPSSVRHRAYSLGFGE